MQSLPGSTIDYQFLGLSRMRNQNISTEIVGNLRTVGEANINSDAESEDGTNGSTTKSASSSDKNIMPKGNPYAVATLDGTIMLVQDEIILWLVSITLAITIVSVLHFSQIAVQSTYQELHLDEFH